MRKIIGGVFQSQDGGMQAPGGPTEDPTGGFGHGSWMVGGSDAAVGKAVGDFFSHPYDLLLGRRTYDIFAAYWPYAKGEGTPSVTLKLVDHVVSPGGIVIATYEPAGPVQNGSFGQIDSPREEDRQRKMKAGAW